MSTTATISASEKATRTDIWKVPVSIVNIDLSRNIREGDYELESLKQYILDNGVEKLPPILVRKNSATDVDLIHGYRRISAIRELEAEGHTVGKIKAIAVAKDYTDIDEMYDHISQNGGKPLTSIEQAKAFKMLEEDGQSRKEIAQRAGVTEAHVCNMLKVLGVSDEVKEQITNGLVTSTLVLNTLNKYGEEADAIIMEAVGVAQETGKKKATAKTVEKVAGDGNGMRTTSTMKKVNKTVEYVATLDGKKAKMVHAMNKVAAIVAVLDHEKDPQVIAEKMVELLH